MNQDLKQYAQLHDENIELKKEIERLKVEMEWISAKDRLPDNGVYVIVKFKDGCIGIDYLASFYKGVTHWMPLPEPPKQ